MLYELLKAETVIDQVVVIHVAEPEETTDPF